jgi:methyl-accepting chemotaxis protein
MRKELQHSIQAKLVVPIFLGAVVVVGLIALTMFAVKAKTTELAGVKAASAVADHVKSMRTYYAKEIVPRAKKAGMGVNFDFDQQENTLPLPATLVKVLGEEMQKTHPGSQVRLYSRFPFPHRAATETYDAFEQEALTAVEKNPQTPFHRLEEINGRLSIRYAVADLMQDACVACHNTHPQSPKKDWQVGDVRGVMEVIVPIDQAAARLQASTVQVVSLTGGAMAVLAGLLVVLFRRSVIKPIQTIAATNAWVSAGDLHARADVQGQDELAAMAAGLNSVLDQLVHLVESTQSERDAMQRSIMKLLEEVSDVAEGDLTAQAEVSADMTGAIADSFNNMIHQLRTIITHVQDATLQVNSSANEIQTTAEHLAQGSIIQAEQITESSAALDEMAVSIQEVSKNATLSANVAEQALANARRGATAVKNTVWAMQRMRDQVQTTTDHLHMLGTRSQEIGDIVRLIADIADRTSVLALNAAIEATLAGEAGQGFAVVAQEVERLAERAAEATRQITGLVSTIQSETNAAATAMEESAREAAHGSQIADQAGQALGEIEKVSTRLAELIQSISQAAAQQARGSENLSKAMGDIAAVTQQTAAGTKQAAVSISHLATLADELRGSVSTFKLPTAAPGHRWGA